VLTTVAWSSAFDSRLVAAGGTLVNLAAALVFWIALRNAKLASVRMRYFLLTRNPTTLAIGSTRDRWRSKWADMVAILLSARNHA
jgi:hypothetical protein